ncbi:uncharacterized protein SCHCODRAFT_01147558 [Schizophyllum commune H4-8]|uniref:uncharacterized protein n=1 Tax=Schizophyllum commune (strain H4-8 / FGSC 9210) TaxID=578458 RepID=UPI0021609A78|nr:uncharacterized protein SCHCODRAFT_01147558 [Schizophyllum commune H4-8]KAI5894498.1 hypothetical protein SCHCODRAFT_01147558 [Schizophyllum commune H4-8]
MAHRARTTARLSTPTFRRSGDGFPCPNTERRKMVRARNALIPPQSSASPWQNSAVYLSLLPSNLLLLYSSLLIIKGFEVCALFLPSVFRLFLIHLQLFGLVLSFDFIASTRRILLLASPRPGPSTSALLIPSQLPSFSHHHHHSKSLARTRTINRHQTHSRACYAVHDRWAGLDDGAPRRPRSAPTISSPPSVMMTSPASRCLLGDDVQALVAVFDLLKSRFAAGVIHASSSSAGKSDAKGGGGPSPPFPLVEPGQGELSPIAFRRFFSTPLTAGGLCAPPRRVGAMKEGVLPPHPLREPLPLVLASPVRVTGRLRRGYAPPFCVEEGSKTRGGALPPFVLRRPPRRVDAKGEGVLPPPSPISQAYLPSPSLCLAATTSRGVHPSLTSIKDLKGGGEGRSIAPPRRAPPLPPASYDELKRADNFCRVLFVWRHASCPRRASATRVSCPSHPHAYPHPSTLRRSPDDIPSPPPPFAIHEGGELGSGERVARRR